MCTETTSILCYTWSSQSEKIFSVPLNSNTLHLFPAELTTENLKNLDEASSRQMQKLISKNADDATSPCTKPVVAAQKPVAMAQQEMQLCNGHESQENAVAASADQADQANMNINKCPSHGTAGSAGPADDDDDASARDSGVAMEQGSSPSPQGSSGHPSRNTSQDSGTKMDPDAQSLKSIGSDTVCNGQKVCFAMSMG